jgi:hypothetical protein
MYPDDFNYEEWLFEVVTYAWYDATVENFLIFVLRYISYGLVAFLKLDPLGQTASMLAVDFILSLFWTLEGLILLAILIELHDIKRYMAIINKYYGVDISGYDYYDIDYWSYYKDMFMVAMAQQILFPVIRRIWFHNIY